MIGILLIVSISILIISIIGLIYAFRENKIKRVWFALAILSALLTIFMIIARDEYKQSLKEQDEINITYRSITLTSPSKKPNKVLEKIF